MPIDLILAIILIVIFGAIILYIVIAKKNGQRCIGCPDSKSCDHSSKKDSPQGGCGGCNGCGSHKNT